MNIGQWILTLLVGLVSTMIIIALLLQCEKDAHDLVEWWRHKHGHR